MSEREGKIESGQNQSEKSTQSIIDGLNQGSLVTETIKKQQSEIMRKMEETVNAAQQKIRKENEKITKIIGQLKNVNNTVNKLVNQSNSILQSNELQLKEAIRVTKKDIAENDDGNNDVKLKSLLNSLREYNSNKITEFNQIGNVYMSFMKNVYTMAGLGDDNESVPERKNDAFSNKIEEEAGILSKIGTGIRSWIGFGGAFSINKTRELITIIHRDLQKRNKMIQNMIVAIKNVTKDMRLIINDIEGIRNSEKDYVLKYLENEDKTVKEKLLVTLFEIPMESISQISQQFGPLLSGMLELASVDGTYESSAPVATSPPPDAAPVESGPAQSFWFWSYLLPSSSPVVTSRVPIKQETYMSADTDTDSDEESVSACDNVEVAVKNILDETVYIKDPKDNNILADNTCNAYKAFVKRIHDIKNNNTYKSCKSSLKGILTKRENYISGIIKKNCDKKTRKSSRIEGGSRRRRHHKKTLKNKRWYLRKARKHIQQKRKYPSRS